MERLSTLASHLGLVHHTRTMPAAAPAGQQQHVLIVGGTGLIGRSCAEHFASLQGWRVPTVARRPLPFSLPGAGSHEHTHLELDLSDREACNAAIRGLPAPVAMLPTPSIY